MKDLVLKIARDTGKSIHTVFEDFLLWVIYSVSHTTKQKWTASGYDYTQFMILLNHLAHKTNAAIKKKGTKHATADVLSALYESVVIGGEKEAYAQYHTPVCVCDLMSSLARHEAPKRLYEPCCGSGKLLLSLCEKYPGIPALGEDIDRLSALMATVNLLINGIEGCIVCRDTLKQSPPVFAYKINEGLRDPRSRWFGIPHIEQIA